MTSPNTIIADMQAELATARAEIATARRTAEYWKENHLSGNLQIAAEQAKNAWLREALEYSIKQVPELATVPGISKALSSLSDTSALEAYIAKAGEKMRIDAMQAADANNQFVTYDAIQMLPGVTLADIAPC